jgi:hypothetical protein
MRGIAVQCACETAYIAVSFSVGLDEPLAPIEARPARPVRPVRPVGARKKSGKARRANSKRASGPAGSYAKKKNERAMPRASTVAHLAEHVIATLTSAVGLAGHGPIEAGKSFESVESVEAVLAALRSTGIVHNAETSGSETCFHASGMPRDLARIWIPLLFAAIRDPNLGSRCVETERSAALDEMYGVRAGASVTDGLLETHIERTEASGSWPTRFDEDIGYLEREKTARVGAAIGAFIRTFYVTERMHVTVVGPDPELLLQTVRLAADAAYGPDGSDGPCSGACNSVLPRAIYTGEYHDGAVSVIAGSEGDTTRVRFLQSVAISSDPVTVFAATCAAWCATELLFVALRVRANAVYSVHAALSMRAVTDAERDGEHDASIVVATVCTHDKAPHVVRVVRDTLRDIGPEIVADWRRAAVVAIKRESRGPVQLGERARRVSVGATSDPLSRSDRIALIESVTYEHVRDVLRGPDGRKGGADKRSGYRVYASTGDTSPTRLRRAVSRGIKKQ